MTLIAGFINGQNIVMCADSEEVVSDYAKSSTQKIQVTQYYGEWTLAIGGAGSAPYIDLFQEKLSQRLSEVKTYDHSRIVGIIEATLLDVHREHIWPRPSWDRDRCDFQTLIAIQGCGEIKARSLYVTQDSSLIHVKEYKSIGVGCYLADYICARFRPYRGRIYNLPTNVVANLAVYVLQQVKESIQSVDGESNVLILGGLDGSMRWLMNDEIKEIEQYMDAYDMAQSPVMLAVADSNLADEEFQTQLVGLTVGLRSIRAAAKLKAGLREQRFKEWQESRKAARQTTQSKPRKSKGRQ